MQNKDPSPKRSCPNHPHRGSWDEKLKNRNVVVMMMMITSWTRSFQASWKWVPKRIPGPPWSVGSAEVLPKQTRNMDPHLFISFDLAPRNAAKSVWNCFLYAFAVCSFAPCMYTLPLLYAIDLLSRALSGTCFMQSYSLVCSTSQIDLVTVKGTFQEMFLNIEQWCGAPVIIRDGSHVTWLLIELLNINW